MSKFKQGESGNPMGRPTGIADKRTQLSKLLQPHAEQIINKVIGYALAGDPDALRLCMERLIPKIKSEPINFELPKDLSNIENLLNNNAAIINAVATGEITIEAAQALSALIESQGKIIANNELTQRLTAIEATLKERRDNEKL